MLEHILIFSFINISRNIISACLAPYPTIVINPNLFQNQNSIIFYNNWKHLFAKPYAYPKFQFLLHISENQTEFPLVLLGAKSRKPLLTSRESPPSQPVNKKLHSSLNFILRNVFLHCPNPKILNPSLFLKLGLNITWNQVVKSQIIIFNFKIFPSVTSTPDLT